MIEGARLAATRAFLGAIALVLLALPCGVARADGWVLGATGEVIDEPARNAPVGAGATVFFEAHFGDLFRTIGVRASAGLDALRGEPRGDVAVQLTLWPWVGVRGGVGIRGGRFWPDDHRRGGAGPEFLLAIDATIPFRDIVGAFWGNGDTQFDSPAVRVSLEGGLVYAVDPSTAYGYVQLAVGLAWLHSAP